MDINAKISELQAKLDEDSTAYMIGEQLKDICRQDPVCAPILLEDLQNPGMGLEAADKKLYDFGKSIAKGKRSVGISPKAAEKVLREFYGLPAASAAPAPTEPAPESLMLDFSAFLG